MEQLPTKEGYKFPNYFEKTDLVILAETWHGKHAKVILDFLNKFGPELKGLLFEMPVNIQSDIDQYLDSGLVGLWLRDMFDGAKKEGKEIEEELCGILDKVRALGIRVYCIDSAQVKIGDYNKKSSIGYYFLKGESRDEDMKNNICEIYQNNPGKYVAIVGGGHMEPEFNAKKNPTAPICLREKLDQSPLKGYASVLLMNSENPVTKEKELYDDVIEPF
jgi:hypothetical protein